MNEQDNTATDIINMLTHQTTPETITITTDSHTFTVYPDGTWTQINH